MSELSRREILGAAIGIPLIPAAVRTLSAMTDIDSQLLFLDASSAGLEQGAAPFKMGSFRSPSGATLQVDSRTLLLNGRPWLPVMGEFHYSRYPAAEWAQELRKLKAGGLDIVASYIFWIHHEEVEGEWDWTGCRDVRSFIKACGDVGLQVLIRCGPWAHGEVRNGGFPDWLQKKGYRLRSDDPGYLAEAKRLYEQISEQLQGLFWKDGGPLIGIQCENEYGGPAQHLLSLKRIAVEAGIDAPLYTRTGWPPLSTPMPYGEFLPLSGAYAEGFWDRDLTSMPNEYGDAFRFLLDRAATTATIGSDLLGHLRPKGNEPAKYPYLCCEIGGGMAVSYHRRVDVTPADVESTALVKIGSGNNLQGYYMYHGGTNPEGKLTTLQESQATNYWNDLPVKTYDFQAPLGEFGQVRPHYHGLRRLHLFLRDWGSSVARQDPVLPEVKPKTSHDSATLRWSVRSDGRHGLLFVNNYQRGQSMPAKSDVCFKVRLPGGEVTVPSRPVTIPENRGFFWPLGMNLDGAELAWATAQPICHVEDDGIRVFLFAAVSGISPEFAFSAGTRIHSAKGRRLEVDGHIVIRDVPTGTGCALEVQGSSGHVRIVVLDDATSRTVYKERIGGRDRLLLSPASIAVDRAVDLATEDPLNATIGFFPHPARVWVDGVSVAGDNDGIFRRFTLERQIVVAGVQIEQLREAGKARVVPIGSQGVAEAPSSADFEAAGVWRIVLDRPKAPGADLLLRLRYAGDVARFFLDGKLLDDNFYNGRPFDLGLKRYGDDIYEKELRLEILPLGKDAPIFLPAKPDFGNSDAVAKVLGLELVPRYHYRIAVE